jgi:hypothetical protein
MSNARIISDDKWRWGHAKRQFLEIVHSWSDAKAWPVDRKGRRPPKMVNLIEAVRSRPGGRKTAPDNRVRVSRTTLRRVRVMSGLQCGSRGRPCT